MLSFQTYVTVRAYQKQVSPPKVKQIFKIVLKSAIISANQKNLEGLQSK